MPTKASKKLVAVYDIMVNGDELQVLPTILKEGHPIDEAKYKDQLDGWKARGLIEERDTDQEVSEAPLVTTLNGDVGFTDPSLLESGIAPPQVSEDGTKVLEPGLTADGKNPADVQKDAAAQKTGK